MTDILMPSLSDSMEQGLVLQWLIDDGQPVKIGDELVEIETDKATMTVQAEVDGVLTVIVPEGATVAVGELIARVGLEAHAQADGAAPAEAAPLVRVPEPARAQSTNGAPSADTAPATPVARRLAAIHGVALGRLHGSGPRGRITKADVLGAAGITAPELATSVPASAPRTNGTHELTRIQQLIARRMAEAKATIPHFQVQTEVEIDATLDLRRQLKEVAEDAPGPSLNDMIVKACAIALSRHPRANGSYKDGRFDLHDHVNVGVAVATKDALIVPTVFDADAKSLLEIARETRRLVGRVRSGEITPPELSGATFTVSNLGMYGMTAITPVINPPQAAILGVGAARPTLARDGDQIVDRSLLTLTLSCDHRILYGADAAGFLAEIKRLLERPLSLCLEMRTEGEP